MKGFYVLLLPALMAAGMSQARTITGTVLSDADSTAVAGAACRLLEKGQSVTSGVADAKGLFSLETKLRDGLRLEISFTGFNPTEILIPDGTKDVALGTVYMNEGKNLKELTVTAGQVVESRGRTIVYPSASDVKASSTALSLFQKLPLAGVEVNPITRSISVDGGSPVYLIDGIPANLDDVQALQAKDIAKVEYSRFTPARYADSGNRGLISITLKKRKDGGNLYIWGRSAVNTAFVDGNVQGKYHQGPSQFTLSYNPSWRNYQKVYDSREEEYVGDDFKVTLRERDRNPFYYHYHTMRLKYDFKPSENTIFSATFRMTPNYSGRRVKGETWDSELGDYKIRSYSHGKSLSPSLDLFLHQNLNGKNYIEAQVVGTISQSDYLRDNRYLFSDGHEDSYITDAKSHRNSLISEVYYHHEFSEDMTLGAGYQNTVSRSTNKYITTDYKPILTENNNYAYIRYGWQIKRVYVGLSTGLKMFWIKNDLNNRRFIKNLSSAVVSWNPGHGWNIYGAFRYTPFIPGLSQLTDYPQQTSPYMIANGNPNLKVADCFTYQIYPSYRYKKFVGSLYMFMQDTKHDVIEDIFYLGGGKFLQQSANSRKSRMYSGQLSLKLSDIYGFGINGNLSLNHYYYAGHDWDNHLTSFSASFTLWWNHGPFTITYWRKFPGKTLDGHNIYKNENGDALSFEYKPDKHWTLGASWMYMFDKKGTRYPQWGYSKVNPYTADRYIKNNGNMVTLSVSYDLSFGTIFRTGNRSLNNSDNGSSLLKL